MRHRVPSIQIVFLISLQLLVVSACQRTQPQHSMAEPADAQLTASTAALGLKGAVRDTEALLVEVTREVGFPEEEAEWPDGYYLTPEITPGGVALWDYDDDGDLDIYQILSLPAAPHAGRFS